MKHNFVISESKCFKIFKEINRLTKRNGPKEISFELDNQEILKSIEVPRFIESFAEENKMSLQDTISMILRCFVLDFVEGRSSLSEKILVYFQNAPIDSKSKETLVKFISQQLKLQERK